MLNQLLETCLSKFEVLTQSAVETLEPSDTCPEVMLTLNTLFTTICPSVCDSPDPDYNASGPRAHLQFAASVVCTGGDRCIQAHSPSQLRRAPFDPVTGELLYLPIPCNRAQCQTTQGAKSTTQSVSASCSTHSGQQAQPRCFYAHTVTEVNYHPYCYRTMPCPKPKGKCKDRHCAFYHSPAQRRDIAQYLSLGKQTFANVSGLDTTRIT